jgi:pimeloyl-ACP methyl ester carboxylesterase
MSTASAAMAGNPATLVVMLHAYTGNAEDLLPLAARVREQLPGAQIHAPRLPLAMFSVANPHQVVLRLLGEIDALVGRAHQAGKPFARIVLVGHSIGGLLARKLYVVACGETRAAPFEPDYRHDCAKGELVQPREWAPLVSRIVLMAGVNRGWHVSHHLSLGTGLWFGLGSVIGHLFQLTSRPLLIFTCRRGAEFITNLRIQSLYMLRAAGNAASALTIQLLGSRDDTVAPEDNVDLVSGGQFIYLDVPYSGHLDVIGVDDPVRGAARAQVFRLALGGTAAQLQAAAVVPADERFGAADESVRRVVFVIHGIRDVGYWTHKVARRVRKLAGTDLAQWATETSSYGYFPMLAFLFPWYRRQKVEWLMDQYTEAVARYPNASFAFVGHSNGTFLLAKALELYPACRFDHVVFAGSVVRKNYDWKRHLEAEPPRVKALLNFVASGDKVVAFFPKMFQDLRLQELGSAGHDGFELAEPTAGVTQVRYVKGGHGAAIDERFWDAIAGFVVTGTVDDAAIGPRETRHDPLLRLLAPFPRNVLVWAFIALVILALWGLVDWLVGRLGLAPMRQQMVRGMALVVYLLGLWVVATRV